MTSDYHQEWQRQLTRKNVPPGHLPVHRWYLRLEDPASNPRPAPPASHLRIIRAEKPNVPFYRFLYHTAGEDYLWGDRRRMSDADLLAKIDHADIHVMVLYDRGTPAGFFEMDFSAAKHSKVNYFALLPGNIGKGLGSYLLNEAICYAGRRDMPLILDTCSLDHSSALENYKKRGFAVYREEDEEYPDPRLDGTISASAGKHLPLAR